MTRPGFPTEVDFTVATEVLDARFQKDGNIQSSLRSYIQVGRLFDNSLNRFVNFSLELAVKLEPFSPPPTRAVLQGSTVALLLAKEVYGEEVQPRALARPRIKFEYEDATDKIHIQYQMAEATREFGDRGLALLGDDAMEKVDSWGETITKDFDELSYYRRAFGVVAFNAAYMHGLAEQEAFFEEVSAIHDLDWNEHLDEFGL